MLVPTLVGRIAFVIGLAALVLAVIKRANTGRRVDSILLATAILLGTVHSVVTMTAAADTALAVATLILVLALLSRLVLAKAR